MNFNQDQSFCIKKYQNKNFLFSIKVIDSPRLEKDWRCGRRLIELGVLADGLSACKKCGLPLQLSHCQGITNFGLSAMLKIPCMNSACKMINNVPTGKRHNKIWDANTKLAAGQYIQCTLDE